MITDMCTKHIKICCLTKTDAAEGILQECRYHKWTLGAANQAEFALPDRREEEAEGRIPRGNQAPQVPSLCSRNRLFFHSVRYLTGLSFILNVTGPALLGFLQTAPLYGRFMASECDHLKGLPTIEWACQTKRKGLIKYRRLLVILLCAKNLRVYRFQCLELCCVGGTLIFPLQDKESGSESLRDSTCLANGRGHCFPGDMEFVRQSSWSLSKEQ